MINYYLITKPGIVLGNLFTFAAGFLLGTRGALDVRLFLITFLGLGLIMASACIFNNYIDRERDRKMSRTQTRALVNGSMSVRAAITYGTILGTAGFALLYMFTNPLALLTAISGFIIYVLIYSLWKSRTVYGTAIGSLAGAVPPVVGYAAASGTIDLAAILLFALLVLWQMPHFFAIALMHLDDYKKAGVPVLPLVHGIRRTKIHMTIYILCFVGVSILFTVLGYTGNAFLTITGLLGLAWLFLSLKGFDQQDDLTWSKRMFQISLVVIGAICIIMPFDKG